MPMDTLYLRSGTPVTENIIQNNKGKYGIIRRVVCPRCGGKGGSTRWNYTGWTCYKCGGAGNLGTRFDRLYTKDE